ncbi:hypothetical protein GBA52_013962 [Prunus armeniaca]|nr:hypothetical protein GBA52_013962 [Prunus armeniaca]
MNNTIWSSTSSQVAEDPVLQLLETGNLVAGDMAETASESYIWQSFNFPSDTLLHEVQDNVGNFLCMTHYTSCKSCLKSTSSAGPFAKARGPPSSKWTSNAEDVARASLRADPAWALA